MKRNKKLRYPFLFALSALSLAARAQGLLTLKNQTLLPEALSAEQKRDAPTFMFGDHLSIDNAKSATISGHAQVRRPDFVIYADNLHFNDQTKQATAAGDVLINQMGSIFTGPYANLNLDSSIGYFENPSYRFVQRGTHGKAKRIDFLSHTKSTVFDATYTSCDCKNPSWLLKAKQIDFDTAADEGIAHNTVIDFKGIPILASPWLSFPLSGKRRSGLLPPTFGFDNINGFEYAQPIYWNIATNQDATFTPVYMNARGVNFKNEYRYLLENSSGVLNFNYMPNDTLRKMDRWKTVATEKAWYGSDWGNFGATINISRVSDNDYWKDFPNASFTPQSQSERLLSNDATISWQKGNFNAYYLLQRWQTLQDTANPIAPPFDRMPQVGADYGTTLMGGINWSMNVEATHFVANSPLVVLPDAKRALVNTQINRTWRNAYSFITPKLQMHAASYTYDKPWINNAHSASLSVPTFSLDSGLYFDRKFQIKNTNFTQTLEPRAMYVYTPYVDQSAIPNYDTAAQDFSFATIFSDNTFIGNDKVADASLLTMGATSRIWNDDTGNELIRLGVAQRIRFTPRYVSLSPQDQPVLPGVSDILMGASIQPWSQWSIETAMQYNTKKDVSEQSLIRTSYHPRDFHVVNFDYRSQQTGALNKARSEQVGASWQWPLNDFFSKKNPDTTTGKYYGVGSMQYALTDNRWVNSLAGIEYDGGCWTLRVLYQNQSTSLTTSTQSVIFQLDLVGLASLGFGSKSALSDNISQYEQLRKAFGNIGSRYSDYP